MNNKNNLVIFENTELQIMTNNNNEIEMDMDELIKALGFENKKTIEKLVENNPELRNKEYSYLKKVLNNEGGILKKREKRVFNQDGIFEIAYLANTERAKQFRRFIKNFSKEMITKFKNNQIALNQGVTALPATIEPKLDKMMELVTQRDLEIKDIFEFFEKAKEYFEMIGPMQKDIKLIKSKVDEIVGAVNELSDAVYGDEDGGEQ
ncbi:BRO family protein [Fusobacterium polymorphum]|uniref:BRO family protein n=1 Tax=Fusobacterium nucleatum subsp. polymorphum TaxID=76857 RepID=UPI0030D4A5EB